MKESWAYKIGTKLGFVIPVTDKKESLLYFFRYILKDYWNNFLFQMARNNWLLGSTISIQFLRPMLNKWRGVKIGKRVAISENTILGLTYPEYISIGDDVRISANVIINEHGRYLKGYGPGKSILDLPVYKKRIRIEDYCHIGLGAIILPGVTIGKGAIIGAGTVVREDVPPYSLVIGNPGKVVKIWKKEEKNEKKSEVKK